MVLGASRSQAGDDPVEQLLAQMSLDEKIGQMVQVDSKAIAGRESDIQKYFLGSVLSGGSSDPAGGNRPQAWRDMVESFKAQAQQTRLKIPLIYGIDAVHGNNNIQGAIIFPHNIGLGATHNPKLVEQAARVTAEETAAVGIRWAFAPCVAVARDDRWGRTYESFGDSTALVSELGSAAVRGLQGRQLSSEPTSVLACAKHFLGDGGTQGGKDQGDTLCDEAALRKLFLPPYVAAIKAGVGSIMVSYSSWNHTKMHAQKYLLTEVLKGELGFQGFLVSDWAAIDQIDTDYKRDVEMSINAGLDMVMIPYGPGHTNNYVEFINDLKDLVKAGKVSPSRIDDAVRRILRVKHQLGLFADKQALVPIENIGSPAHRQAARECVRESLVLLKNENHALPLSKKLKRIQVVGQAADDLGLQCGGWTIDWQGRPGNVTPGGTTLLAAIRQAVSPDAEIIFTPTGKDLKKADVTIVVIAEQPYAEGKGDRSDLSVASSDLALVQEAKKTGSPVVTILFSGRTMVLDTALSDSNAFIAAWLPGTEGTGMADVLFGDHKPTGKLPRAWPGNQPQSPGEPITAGNALFPLGFGLSY